MDACIPLKRFYENLYDNHTFVVIEKYHYEKVEDNLPQTPSLATCTTRLSRQAVRWRSHVEAYDFLSDPHTGVYDR